MGFGTSLPERKVAGFTIVNYSSGRVIRVFLVSLQLAGFCVVTAASFSGFGITAGLLMWLAFTLAVFMLIMKFRDRAVRREIEEGRHDPLWGKHICQQIQREADAFHERNRLTRPLYRLACLLGIHKKQ